MNWDYPKTTEELPPEKLDRAMMLRNGLVSLCEGRDNMNAALYSVLRREFLGDSESAPLVPQFVRAAHDTKAMWAYLKDLAPQWEPRRKFVREQFAALIDRLESQSQRGPQTVMSQAAAEKTSSDRAAIYNLLVSSSAEAWDTGSHIFDEGRCVNRYEYTDEAVAAQYGSFDPKAIAALTAAPAIFAYESGVNVAPKFGYIRDVTKRLKMVRVEFEVLPVQPFIEGQDFDRLRFELGIGALEMNRTHWAVKGIDLAKELAAHGIQLPRPNSAKAVDVAKHVFDVALSFPGEARSLVAEVAGHLERILGPDRYFYDLRYQAQLARPNLDILLQELYRHRAKLVVLFLGPDYQKKMWPGVEFRAIREIIAEREHERVMFIRTDDGQVDGVFRTDGYIDARNHSPEELAIYIKQRVDLLPT